MARSERLRRPGRGLKSEDQIKAKNGSDTPKEGGGFRLIVDGQGTFDPGTCTPPRRALDDAVSPSTIKLKRASTIAEIRSASHALPGVNYPELHVASRRNVTWWFVVVQRLLLTSFMVAAGAPPSASST